MYRLLIVDDEEIIADALYDVFKNLKEPELDVYKAYSSEEALEWLNRTRIDIVLTDIRMPGMDGLQLLEKIRISWPKCKVIFLTGYNEFDYVYTAIQYEGVSYLLKTEGYDKVIQAVNHAVYEIETSFKLDELIQKANEQIYTATALMQKEYFLNLLHGNHEHFKITQQEFVRLGVLLCAEAPVLLLIGRIDTPVKEASYFECIERISSIKILTGQYFGSQVISMSISEDLCNLIWFIQPTGMFPEDKTDQTKEAVWSHICIYLKGTLEMIQTLCKSSVGVSIAFAMGSEPSSWDSVADKYELLKSLLDYKIGSGEGMLLTDKQIDFRKDFALNEFNIKHVHVKNAKMKMLETHLQRNQVEDFFRLFSEVTELQLEVSNANYKLGIEIYYSISLMLMSYVNKWNIAEKISVKISLDKLMRIDMHDSLPAAFEYLCKLACAIFDTQDYEQEKRAVDSITFIKKYINEHIDEELSLVVLSELVYFNPSYLSRLFKQVTGLNVTDYIYELKIEHAKKLLEIDSVKIYEIAEAVGYTSATNFIRFFKKMTNSTPQEYREKLLSKNPNTDM